MSAGPSLQRYKSYKKQCMYMFAGPSLQRYKSYKKQCMYIQKYYLVGYP